MDIEKHRKTFQSYFWVEDKRKYIKTLPRKTAKDLLDSLENWVVSDNVNRRKYQEDYICDYLRDVWSINRKAFWRHIENMCARSAGQGEGFVLGEDTSYIERMCSGTMPMSVWRGILWMIAKLDRKDAGYDIMVDFTARIIVAQTTSARDRRRKQTELKEWLQTLDKKGKIAAMSSITGAFGKNLPDWLGTRLPNSRSSRSRTRAG